ncbi:MAG: hypothetical protein ABIQ86_11935 [Steroidobacteraceae bacterium]
MSTSKPIVFISYASPDAAMANAVVSQLERAGLPEAAARNLTSV